jgi:hypothetical protein
VRLIIDIQPGGGDRDLAEDLITFLNDLNFISGGSMTIEVDRSKADADEDREIVVKITEED